MKKNFYNIIAGFLLFPFLLFLGCTEEPAPSIYDSVVAGKPAPTIAAINPAEAYAVVTPITITGTNFSSVPEENFVYFDGKPGKVLSASPTQLIALSADVISDTAVVKIRVTGAENFSNVIRYKLLPVYREVKQALDKDLFSKDVVPYGITTDMEGNIYTSVVEFSIGKGIKKISPTGAYDPVGALVDFAPKGGETFFNKLNMYQNSTILAARRQPAVFEIASGVAAKVFQSSGLTAIYDIDVDKNLNVWAAGKGLYMITPTTPKVVKSFPNTNDIKAVRIFNDHLYILTTVGEDDIIRRFPINYPDGLGEVQDFFNVGQSVLPDTGSAKIDGIDFEIAENGDIILGTTKNTNPIVVVHQNGTSEPLYPGVIPSGTRLYALDWGVGEYLFFTREASTNKTQSIFRIIMQRNGAPHFGR